MKNGAGYIFIALIFQSPSVFGANGSALSLKEAISEVKAKVSKLNNELKSGAKYQKKFEALNRMAGCKLAKAELSKREANPEELAAKKKVEARLSEFGQLYEGSLRNQIQNIIEFDYSKLEDVEPSEFACQGSSEMSKKMESLDEYLKRFEKSKKQFEEGLKTAVLSEFQKSKTASLFEFESNLDLQKAALRQGAYDRAIGIIRSRVKTGAAQTAETRRVRGLKDYDERNIKPIEGVSRTAFCRDGPCTDDYSENLYRRAATEESHRRMRRELKKFVSAPSSFFVRKFPAD